LNAISSSTPICKAEISSTNGSISLYFAACFVNISHLPLSCFSFFSSRCILRSFPTIFFCHQIHFPLHLSEHSKVCQYLEKIDYTHLVFRLLEYVHLLFQCLDSYFEVQHQLVECHHQSFSFLLIFSRYNLVLDQMELILLLKHHVIGLQVQRFFRVAGC
jgi:hypothetical protein